MDNPKRGDVREDGMVFAYTYKKGRYQRWMTPERFAVFIEDAKQRSRKQAESLKGTVRKPRKTKQCVQRDPETVREYSRRYRSKDPEAYRAKQRAYMASEKVVERNRSSTKRLAHAVRVRIWNALKGNKEMLTIAYLGCSFDELRVHLEDQFQPGMTWENYGLDGWHIDHRIPIASAETIEDLIPLLHYSNLQPLWAFDNLSKGAKILH